MFPERSALGCLRIVEVFVFHDGPKLFLAANDADQLFVVLWADFDDEIETWLYAPVSVHRVEALRAGHFDVRDVFTESDTGYLWRGQYNLATKEWQIETIPAEAVDTSQLPDPGYRVRPETVDPDTDAKEVELRTLSERIRRDVLLFSLHFERKYTVEAPARELGALLGSWQEQLDVLGQAQRGKFGRGQSIMPEVLEQTEMLVDSTFRSSFGLRLIAAMPADLTGESLAALAIGNALKLLEADEGVLRDLLKQQNPRIAVKFRRLLASLLDIQANLGLVWQQPTCPQPKRLFVPLAHVNMAYAVASEMGEEFLQVVKVEGVLTGCNVRTKTFEIMSTIDNKRYTGRILPTALRVAAHATLSELYKATIHVITEAETATGVEKTQTILAELEPA